MATEATSLTLATLDEIDLQAARKQWGWVLALGICLLILGTIAVIDAVAFTVISMLFFGWIMVIAGIVEGVHAIRHRANKRLFLHLLNAVLSLVVGVLLLRNPTAGAAVFTLLLMVYFLVAGIFRIAAAFRLRPHPGWGWTLFNGIVTLILGILVWNGWPGSAMWVIGLLIGIELLMVGWTQVMIALLLRRVPPAA